MEKNKELIKSRVFKKYVNVKDYYSNKAYYKKMVDDCVLFIDKVKQKIDEYEADYHVSFKPGQVKTIINRATILFIDFDIYTSNYRNPIKQKCLICGQKEELIFSVICDLIKDIANETKIDSLKLSQTDIKRDVNYFFRNKLSSLIPCYHSHQKKTPVFLSSTKDKASETRYFGLEIESYGRCENALEISDFNDLFSPEEDGSLPDESFELVSEPMTFKYIIDNKKRISRMLEILRENGQKVNCSCGLHIHVSRNAFINEDATIRASRILGAFKADFETLAMRKENQCYYQYAPSVNQQFLWIQDDEKDWFTSDRYYAVNLRNDETVEFRIFKSTLHIEDLLAYVQLVDNVVNISNSGKTLIKSKDIFKGTYICKFLKEHKIHLREKEFDLDALDFKVNCNTIKSIKRHFNSDYISNFFINLKEKFLIIWNKKHTAYIEVRGDDVTYHFPNTTVSLKFNRVKQSNAWDTVSLLESHVDNFVEICSKLKDNPNLKIKKKDYKNFTKVWA